MDTLALLLFDLFSQAYREHPAPPMMEKLLRFLEQPKLCRPRQENTAACLQETANCAMISKETEEKRKNTHD